MGDENGTRARIEELDRRVTRVEASFDAIMSKLSDLATKVATLVQQIQDSGKPGQSEWCHEHLRRLAAVELKHEAIMTKDVLMLKRKFWFASGVFAIGTIVFGLMLKHLIDAEKEEPWHTPITTQTSTNSAANP